METRTKTTCVNIQELLGELVVTNKQKYVNVETLCRKDSILGLYFAAQWCPSCVEFTRDLIEFYNNFKATASRREVDMDIVLVSLDEDGESWRVTFRDMPWMAVPFHDVETLEQIRNEFGIYTIPSLVLLDASNGNIITMDGRKMVLEDKKAECYPWI